MAKENNNGKLVAGLLIGAAAGSLITLFLQGEKGKQLIRNVKVSASNAGEDLKDGLSRLQYTTDNLLKKGKKFVQDLTASAPQGEEDAEFDEIFS